MKISYKIIQCRPYIDFSLVKPDETIGRYIGLIGEFDKGHGLDLYIGHRYILFLNEGTILLLFIEVEKDWKLFIISQKLNTYLSSSTKFWNEVPEEEVFKIYQKLRYENKI